MYKFLFLLALCFGSLLGFAQEVVIPSGTNEDFLMSLLQLLGGGLPATTLAIAGIVVQLLMKFLVTPWADKLLDKNGAYKLLAYLVLSYVAGILLTMTAGASFAEAAFGSTGLAALMLVINQVYKQFVVKKD